MSNTLKMYERSENRSHAPLGAVVSPALAILTFLLLVLFPHITAYPAIVSAVALGVNVFLYCTHVSVDMSSHQRSLWSRYRALPKEARQEVGFSDKEVANFIKTDPYFRDALIYFYHTRKNLAEEERRSNSRSSHAKENILAMARDNEQRVKFLQEMDS